MPPKRRGRGGGRGPGRPKKVKKAETDSEHEASSSDDEKGFSKDKFLSVLRYDFDRLISTKNFEHKNLIGKIDPESFNIDYYEETGLETPLFFNCNPRELGMKVPDAATFSVNSVLDLVGGDRVIEVVEVSGQTSVKMNLKEFVDYYNTPKDKRTTLYNVLSLEFTLDKLRDVVQGPSLVRDVDWVENCWPDALHQRFISFTKKGYQLHHTFPKVQNYCLMSVERCYTDFHIDFGGTSVWYHVLKGRKIFWMVEPTEANIRVYEEFIKNPEQTGFFGDVVDRCVRVVLNPGDTMIIPSGWIHAVFTPVDSLVFGGNFLHTLRASMQIRVFQSENRISITKKFRFPYLDQLIFYMLSQVVEEVTGRKYARPLHIRDAKLDYVGKLWIKQNGHHKLIKAENFQTDINSSHIFEDEANHEPGSKNVIAMHAENTIYDSKTSEGDAIAREVTEGEERPSEMDIMKKGIFYHEQSPLFDLHGKSTAAHKNPVGEEPEIVFEDDKLNFMSVKRLIEYEKLCDYMRKKRLVEVAEGITKPASLLQTFQLVLARRRTTLEESGEVLDPAPWASKKKRSYRRISNHESLISPIKKTNHFLNKSIRIENQTIEALDTSDIKLAETSSISEMDVKEDESDVSAMEDFPKQEESHDVSAALKTDEESEVKNESAAETDTEEKIEVKKSRRLAEKKVVVVEEKKPRRAPMKRGRPPKDKSLMEKKSKTVEQPVKEEEQEESMDDGDLDRNSAKKPSEAESSSSLANETESTQDESAVDGYVTAESGLDEYVSQVSHENSSDEKTVENAAKEETPEESVPVKFPETAAVEIPEETAPIEDPEEAAHVQTSEEAASVETSEKAAPVETSEEAATVETPEEATPVETPEEATPIETSEEAAPLETSEKAAPLETSEKAAPVETSEEAATVETPEEATPVETPKESAPIESAEEAGPGETTEEFVAGEALKGEDTDKKAEETVSDDTPEENAVDESSEKIVADKTTDGSVKDPRKKSSEDTVVDEMPEKTSVEPNLEDTGVEGEKSESNVIKSDTKEPEESDEVSEEMKTKGKVLKKKAEAVKDAKKGKGKAKRKSSQKSDHGIDKSFEEALAGAKPKRKSDSRKDKPLYAGGFPLLPLLEDEPVVPNPYNYDPKAEIMKLGTGQLKSAYRKSKTNIEPPKEKKIYKLEHKIHEEEKNESPLYSPGSSTQVKDFMKSNYFPRVHENVEASPVKKLSADNYTERNFEHNIKKSVEKVSVPPPYVPNKSKVEEPSWKAPVVVPEKPSQSSPVVIHHRPIDPRIPEPVKPAVDSRPSDPRKPVEIKKLIPAAVAITKIGEVVRQLESLNNQW